MRKLLLCAYVQNVTLYKNVQNTILHTQKSVFILFVAKNIALDCIEK